MRLNPNETVKFVEFSELPFKVKEKFYEMLREHKCIDWFSYEVLNLINPEYVKIDDLKEYIKHRAFENRWYFVYDTETNEFSSIKTSFPGLKHMRFDYDGKCVYVTNLNEDFIVLGTI